MTRPRILIFSFAYLPFVGGAEVAVKEITDRLRDHDFEMITVNLDGRQEKIERSGNILVRRVEFGKYLFPLTAYRLAVKLHQEKKYDVIWAIMANQAGMAAALFKRRFPSMPFLLTLQEGDDLNSLAYQLRLLGPRLFRVFQRADHVTAISNYLARWARQMGARCPVTVVPNGVNLTKFKLQATHLAVGQANYKLQANPVIITTSRLVKKNGVDTLIESLRFLPDNVRLQILGTGPEEMSLKQLMSRLHLDRRVEFLGQVPPNGVLSYLARADVFVRPSRSEGLGNSFLEAMAAGVPVVGTPVGGIPDFLRDGETGWFCEVDNPESIAAKVKFILDLANREVVEKIINKAYILVQEKYSWDDIANHIAMIFNKIL